MEIFIIILLLICVLSFLKMKTSIFDFNSMSIENMTCDRNDTKSCIYDDMIVAGKNCIYGKIPTIPRCRPYREPYFIT